MTLLLTNTVFTSCTKSAAEKEADTALNKKIDSTAVVIGPELQDITNTLDSIVKAKIDSVGNTPGSNSEFVSNVQKTQMDIVKPMIANFSKNHPEVLVDVDFYAANGWQINEDVTAKAVFDGKSHEVLTLEY